MLANDLLEHVAPVGDGVAGELDEAELIKNKLPHRLVLVLPENAGDLAPTDEPFARELPRVSALHRQVMVALDELL